MAGNLHNLSLRQLRAIAAVARSGSVTEAADRLNLTQPAVTLQIRNLQELVDLPLLERTADGMVPTDAGRALLALYDRVATAIGDCANELDMIRGLTGGRVSIGVVSTAKYFAPFAIAAFGKAYPDIEVRLTIGNREEIIRALRDFALDIAVIGRPPTELPLERVLIGDHPHVIVAPPSHPLSGKAQVKVQDLAGELFIIREPGSGTRALMEKLFAQSGVTPRIGMEITSNETIKQAVMAGLGVAFISGHTVASEVADGRLAVLSVEGLPLVRQWYVVHRPEKVLLPPSRALLEFMGREAVRFLPSMGRTTQV
jgi:LysR family transcriptional regulator for metE and metH